MMIILHEINDPMFIFMPTFIKFRIHMPTKDVKIYWKRNLRYLLVLLTIWFLVSFGAGILFKDQLDTIKIAGFPLGFWFAQQGAIYFFIAIIFIYVRLMNKLDEEFDVNEQ